MTPFLRWLQPPAKAQNRPFVPTLYIICIPMCHYGPLLIAVKTTGWKMRTVYAAPRESSEALAPLWMALSPSFHTAVCLMLLISHARSPVRVIPHW